MLSVIHITSRINLSTLFQLSYETLFHGIGLFQIGRVRRLLLHDLKLKQHRFVLKIDNYQILKATNDLQKNFTRLLNHYDASQNIDGSWGLKHLPGKLFN